VRAQRTRPPMLVTPYWVCVLGNERLLQWGLFDRKAHAELRADAACTGSTRMLRSSITTERVWISRRAPR
jgi:hypothetical protein